MVGGGGVVMGGVKKIKIKKNCARGRGGGDRGGGGYRGGPPIKKWE